MSSAKNKKKLIVLLGPTASGKTALSIALSKKFNGEVVSADSRQIYRYMDIGTSKATKRERSAITHHLIDIASPDKTLTLSQWQRRAFNAIKAIHAKGQIPFLVGGTGLYISSIVDNYQLPKTKPNQKLRHRLEKLSTDALFKELTRHDPLTAKTIDKHNKRRLVRALEFVLSSRKSFSENQRTRSCPYDVLLLGIAQPNEKLYSRINLRVDAMIRAGLEKEVRKLVKKYQWDLPSMQSIGYQEWREYFENGCDKEKVVAMIKQHSRNYAKRQMTWFRRMEKQYTIHWVASNMRAKGLIQHFLEN